MTEERRAASAEAPFPARGWQRWLRGRPSGGRAALSWWVAMRVGQGLLTLAIVASIVFFAARILPSDPAKLILGVEATQQQLDDLREQLGLNKPVLQQYAEWIAGLARGDMGTSITTGAPVADLVLPRLINSGSLVLVAASIGIPLAILMGILAAVQRDRAFDHFFMYLTMLVTALPGFVIGLLLVIAFSTTLFRFLPAVVVVPPGENPLQYPAQLVLLVTTLVLECLPQLGRQVRGSMIEILDSEYVQLARLKGARKSRVVFRHALPNAIVPGVQASALVLAWLVGGIVVIEYLFSYPGLGSLLAASVTHRDLPVVQMIVLIFGAAYIGFNILADLLTILLTPRLRAGLR